MFGYWEWLKEAKNGLILESVLDFTNFLLLFDPNSMFQSIFQKAMIHFPNQGSLDPRQFDCVPEKVRES